MLAYIIVLKKCVLELDRYFHRELFPVYREKITVVRPLLNTVIAKIRKGGFFQMKKFNKLLSLMLVLAMVLSMAACGAKSEPAAPAATEAPAAAET